MNWKNILERAAWTFLQGFLGVFSVGVISDLDALKATGVAALGAGIAALLSFVKTVAQEKLAA